MTVNQGRSRQLEYYYRNRVRALERMKARYRKRAYSCRVCKLTFSDWRHAKAHATLLQHSVAEVM